MSERKKCMEPFSGWQTVTGQGAGPFASTVSFPGTAGVPQLPCKRKPGTLCNRGRLACQGTIGDKPVMETPRLRALGLIAALVVPLPCPQDGARIATRSGIVRIANGAITLNVPADHAFAEGAEARRVLETLWGNRAEDAVVGLVLPPEVSGQPPWAVVVSWHADVWVDDAAVLPDDGTLLREMRLHAAGEGGAPAVDIVGWAMAPAYRRAGKSLTWATRLRFPDDDLESVNVHHALLLRRGWVQLTAISPVPALETMRQGIEALVRRLEVQPHDGHDANPPADVRARLTLADVVTNRHASPGAARSPSEPARDYRKEQEGEAGIDFGVWMAGSLAISLALLAVMYCRRR